MYVSHQGLPVKLMAFTMTFTKGGPESGHHGHGGLKGVWGGSTPSGGKTKPEKVSKKGRRISREDDGYETAREQFKTLQSEDTLHMFHGMQYKESMIKALEGKGLDPSVEAHDKGRIFGGGEFKGYHLSASKRVAGNYGFTVFEVEVKAKDLIAPPHTHHDVKGVKAADDVFRSIYPNSFRPSLSNSLRGPEQQGLLTTKIPVSQIKRVWIYNSQAKTKWTSYSPDEALEIIRVRKEFIEEKQLPIGEEGKATLLTLRRNMFWDHMDGLAEEMYTGEISIGQWQETFKDYMRQFYSSSAAIGKGGWDNMTWADWGRLGPVMKDQYRYLQGFADHIYDNRDTISLKYIKARSRLYGEGGAYGAALLEAGVVFEALLPWLPRDGSTECLNRCHCSWMNSISGKDKKFNIVRCVWTLGKADHCGTCVDRDGYVEQIRVHETVEVPSIIGGY